jgi:hypothetical protein
MASWRSWCLGRVVLRLLKWADTVIPLVVVESFRLSGEGGCNRGPLSEPSFTVAAGISDVIYVRFLRRIGGSDSRSSLRVKLVYQ